LQLSYSIIRRAVCNPLFTRSRYCLASVTMRLFGRQKSERQLIFEHVIWVTQDCLLVLDTLLDHFRSYYTVSGKKLIP